MIMTERRDHCKQQDKNYQTWFGMETLRAYLWHRVSSQRVWRSRRRSPCSVVNFINVLHKAFTHIDPKSVKRYRRLDWVLTLWGATGIKAVRKTLVKLTPARAWRWTARPRACPCWRRAWTWRIWHRTFYPANIFTKLLIFFANFLYKKIQT